MRLMGIDPGLRRMGWGVIESDRGRLRFIASGVLTPDPSLAMAVRLARLHDGLAAVLSDQGPAEVAVEETFVNQNPRSTLKLGQARAVALLVPALAALPVAEYPANAIKLAVTGAGHADKAQMRMMVRTLLPGARIDSDDAADALGIAICHAHHRETAGRITAWQQVAEGAR